MLDSSTLQNTCYKQIQNKKVPLCERKRHTARRVASPWPGGVTYLGQGGAYLCWGGTYLGWGGTYLCWGYLPWPEGYLPWPGEGYPPWPGWGNPPRCEKTKTLPSPILWMQAVIILVNLPDRKQQQWFCL